MLSRPRTPANRTGGAAAGAASLCLTPTPTRTIRSVAVSGNQRLEAETVLSYTALRPGEPYDQERLDQALRDLYATELFADVTISGGDTGDLVIEVRENPVINRIVLEGNQRIKDDKITPEIRLAPRQIFTRSQGPRRRRPDHRALPSPGPLRRHRRAEDRPARPEPRRRRVRDQRRAASRKVRQINIIGNEQFCDGQLRQRDGDPRSALVEHLQSNDTYDPGPAGLRPAEARASST